MIIFKNAFVLNLNHNPEFGRYSILVNGNKITDIADNSSTGKEKVEKWIEQHIEAEIIDCTWKLIMPPLANACLRSEASLIYYLMKRRNYEKAEEDLCTELIFNYLYQEIPGNTLTEDLQNIYDYSFIKSAKSGTGYINEFSLRKDTIHLHPITNAIKKTGQSIIVSYPIKQDPSVIRDYKYLNPAVYVTQENLLTVFDISGITELRNHNIRKLFLEVAVNKNVTENFKQSFHKSVIALFDEYGLIDENTSLINPIYLDYSDLKIITEKKASIIITPSDLNFFASRYFPIDDYISHGIKYSIATGWLGNDLLSEMRIFRNKHQELELSSIDLLRSITVVPHKLYFENESANSSYLAEVNKPATFAIADLSDVRFQYFPEDNDIDRVCDFLSDNLTSYNFTSLVINGEFRIRDNKIDGEDEAELVKRINDTRGRLYEIGKYEDLKKKKNAREKNDKLDLSHRTEDEIKLFSEPESEVSADDNTEEFRIKTKIPVLKQKKIPGQRNLFEEFEHTSIVQQEDELDAPKLNLLDADPDSSKTVEEDFIQSKAVDETIIKRLSSTSKKSEKTVKPENIESKIELPKNVKLKFGDD